MTKRKATPKTIYIDNPYISETFADSVRGLSFDGQTMRIEFCTTRIGEPKPPSPPQSKQFPACRLVLTPKAALDLHNNLSNMIKALEKDGVFKRDIPTPTTVN